MALQLEPVDERPGIQVIDRPETHDPHRSIASYRAFRSTGSQAGRTDVAADLFDGTPSRPKHAWICRRHAIHVVGTDVSATCASLGP